MECDLQPAEGNVEQSGQTDAQGMDGGFYLISIAPFTFICARNAVGMRIA